MNGSSSSGPNHANKELTSSNCFQMAAEGWQIISGSDDARQSARLLLRWMAESLNLSAAELSFQDETDGYSWQERVGRVIPGLERMETWTHPFPTGSSSWNLEGDVQKIRSYEVLLDLLADQWLKVCCQKPYRTEPVKVPTRPVRKIPGWTAVNRRSRIVKSQISTLALSQTPLLLVGESGSGRSYIASLIHAHGPDPAGSFGGPGIPIEPEEFGTLYISDWRNCKESERGDYISDSRRLIAATSPELRGENLREEWLKITQDKGVVMTVPSLRERKEDIASLAGSFLEELSVHRESKAPEISPSALEALQAYSWPGNIAELQKSLAQTLEKITTSERRILVRHLPPQVRGALAAEKSFRERLGALEYEALRKELSRQRGNMTRTAHALGLTPRQVSWRVRKYGINPRDFKPHLRVMD